MAPTRIIPTDPPAPPPNKSKSKKRRLATTSAGSSRKYDDSDKRLAGAGEGKEGKSWREMKKKDYRWPAERDYLDRPFTRPTPPTAAYLIASTRPSHHIPRTEEREPLIVVLSLLDTLFALPSQPPSPPSPNSPPEATKPLVRPFLSTFLQYVCGADSTTGWRRFLPTVFSSLPFRGEVLPLLTAIGLVPPETVQGHLERGEFRPEVGRGEVLRAVVGREDVGLDGRDFGRDVPVGKDLAVVVRSLDLNLPEERGALDEVIAKRVVLIDNEQHAASQHPHNRLPTLPFRVHTTDFPQPGDRISLSYPSSSPACELPLGHPRQQDPHLLLLIYYLERLRAESNVGGALSAGFVEKVRKEVEEEMVQQARKKGGGGPELKPTEKKVSLAVARKGREVCRRLGIEVRERWDPLWRVKMVNEEVGIVLVDDPS